MVFPSNKITCHHSSLSLLCTIFFQKIHVQTIYVNRGPLKVQKNSVQQLFHYSATN